MVKRLFIAFLFIIALLTFQLSSQETHAQGNGYKVYLPINIDGADAQAEPTPPTPTTSLYIYNYGSFLMWSLGCDLARQVQDYEESQLLVFLQYGRPETRGTIHGAQVYGSADFVPMSDLEEATYYFSYGYSVCAYDYENSDTNLELPWLSIGVSLNNGANAAKNNLSTEHGAAWADMTARVNNRLNSPRNYVKSVVFPAGDLELEYNTPTNTKNWVNGVLSRNIPFYNLGTASCPITDTLNENCEIDSTLCPNDLCVWWHQDLWEISGLQGTRVVPQIYRADGLNARQWYELAKYGEQLGTSSAIDFEGALTTRGACQQTLTPDQQEECLLLRNTPDEAWNQLRQILDEDPSMKWQTLPFATDIKRQID